MYSIAFNPHSNSFQLRDRKHLKIVGFDRLLGDFWPGFGVPTFHMVARQQGRLPVLIADLRRMVFRLSVVGRIDKHATGAQVCGSGWGRVLVGGCCNKCRPNKNDSTCYWAVGAHLADLSKFKCYLSKICYFRKIHSTVSLEFHLVFFTYFVSRFSIFLKKSNFK
jgi:hypothetical protein